MAAFCDLLCLLMIHFLYSGLSESSHYVSSYAQDRGWARTAQAVGFFGQHAPKFVYAHGIKTEGLVNTVLSLASGAMGQAAMECAGNYAIQFYSKPVEKHEIKSEHSKTKKPNSERSRAHQF